MNVKATCYKCGQLDNGCATLLEYQHDENGHKVSLELKSQTQSEQSLLDLFTRDGVEMKASGNKLTIEVKVEPVVTDEPEEATVTPKPAPQIVVHEAVAASAKMAKKTAQKKSAKKD